jgi:phosphoribosylanthranilate isomerase
MIGELRLKVCGITSAGDAELAEEAGADYLGFILYPESPRGITSAQFGALAPRVSRRKVAVCVTPSVAEIESYLAAGADFIQAHFPPEIPFRTLQAWSRAAGAGRLWLAPRLPPQLDVPPGWLPLAHAFLLDTFDPEKFGGTGQAGDRAKFARHARAHPETTWILSGGLNASNITLALRESGAMLVDVNSGVESSPGVKDRAKLHAFADAVRTIREPNRSRP